VSQTPTASGDKAKRVELIIAQLDSLPTLPAVAARLLQVTTDGDTHAKQVTQLIESDQSLTAKILSLVRRASVGAGSSVSTVDRAVVLMGFDAIRNAVLSIKVFEVFGPQKQEAETTFDRAEFWKHSLAVACAAQLIAEAGPDGPGASGRVSPEDAFVCGLLHDLGKVALDTCLPKSFDRVVRAADSGRACIADVERQLLGIDHTVVGRRLGERWSLPEPVVQCMWLHHHGPDALPSSMACLEQVQIVHLADLIARHQRIGYSGSNWTGSEDPQGAAARLGIDQDRYEAILRNLPDRIEQRASIIGLGELSSKELYAQALADANDELSRLNASLTATNRKLQARSRHFQALSHLTRQITPRAPMQQVCLAAAESVRVALGADAVLVFVRRPEEGYLELALVDPSLDDCITEVLSPEGDCLLTGEMDDAMVEVAAGGAWILPALPQAQALVDRYGGQLGDGPYWLLPIVRDGEWVGGAVLSAPARTAVAWRNEVDELASLSTSIGLVMRSTRVRQAADRLSEDLADASRRMQQMQAQLLRTQSLSMIGEMAAGAAHELNNPLAIITGRAQMLRTRTDDPETQELLSLINEQAHRCSQIVSELMEFAKPRPPTPQQISLVNLLYKVRASWLAKSWLTESRFAFQLSDGLPEVWIDPAQLEQVLEEVISNAVEAMDPKEGRLSINCRPEPSDERVVLTVEDNGRGMDSEVLRKAFDPFYSHRPAGRNRGLGLARTYRLVDGNGGQLRLESTPGKGTIVILELPTGQERVGGTAEVTSSRLTAREARACGPDAVCDW